MPPRGISGFIATASPPPASALSLDGACKAACAMAPRACVRAIGGVARRGGVRCAAVCVAGVSWRWFVSI